MLILHEKICFKTSYHYYTYCQVLLNCGGSKNVAYDGQLGLIVEFLKYVK